MKPYKHKSDPHHVLKLFLSLLWFIGLGLAACGEESGQPKHESASFAVRASVGQLHIWDATPQTVFEVVDSQNHVVASDKTDDQGSLVFRNIPPQKGYQVRLQNNPQVYTNQLDVLSVEESLPDESFYASQKLGPGFGYITTRDGTKLSVYVNLPGPADEGPYPTIVNYSGYSPSKPGQPLGDEVAVFCNDYPILCDAPTYPSGLLAGLLKFASVGVNIRGTGCSGGAYDYFEPLQLLDGYDVIEVIARQDWVLHHKVGMAGLSYPGITQLFVASTNPPSLAAISPMSVLADTTTSTLAPGGIYNIGFAIAWIDAVLRKADPYGQGWEQTRVEQGDTICEENQKLHSQKLDAVAKAYDNPYYTDEIAKPLDPSSFVNQIKAPVYLTGQWQDEQTGPHFPALFDKFTNAQTTRFAATNGVHVDGFSAQYIIEWAIFLQLYVSKQVPQIDSFLYTMAPLLFQSIYGASLQLPENRFADYTSYEQALLDYEAEDPLRIIFESGAAAGVPAGAPQGTFEASFSAWPIPSTVATRWYFFPDGSLQFQKPPAAGGACEFEHDPEAGDRTNLNSGSVGGLQPDYNWRPLQEGKAVAFISSPLEQDLVLVGHGSVDLWLQSSAQDADLEVCLSEVRSDGQESYVQSGWLRASHRALRGDATELRPVKTHLEKDAKPLVAGEWNQVRVELMPFGHIFRKDSRIRISVDTPGDNMARWRFILLDYPTPPVHKIAHNSEYASSVVLPVIPNIEIPSEQPACQALRGQPCRLYTDLINTPASW